MYKWERVGGFCMIATVQLRDMCQHHDQMHSELVLNSFEMSLYWSANMFTNVVTNVITVVCFLDVFAFVLICFVLLFSIFHKARAPQHSLGIVMLDWKECELNEFGTRFYVRICLWAALCMYCAWQNAGELSHCTDKGTVHVVWPQPVRGFYNVKCKRGHRGNHWLKTLNMWQKWATHLVWSSGFCSGLRLVSSDSSSPESNTTKQEDN